MAAKRARGIKTVVLNGKRYASAASACRGLGLEVKGDSAVRVLERWARDNHHNMTCESHGKEIQITTKLGTSPPPSGPDKLAGQIKDFVDKLVELAKLSTPTPVPDHDELIRMGREMGEMLGKKVDTETGPIYKHDVSWKDNQWTTPGLVIEICDKGVLDKDIQSLNWAVQNWGAKCILVIVDDKDYDNALKKLGTSTPMHVIKAVDFQRLHSLVSSAGMGILKAIFSI